MPRISNSSKKNPVLIAFQDEILGDMDILIEDHPEGITVSDLVEYYGENINKILRAIDVLADDRCAILKHVRLDRSIIIYPLGYDPQNHGSRYILELTAMQGKIVKYIQDRCYYTGMHLANKPYDRISTTFSSIGRATECSSGGAKNATMRCVELGYLQLFEPYDRSQHQLTIGPTEKCPLITKK